MFLAKCYEVPAQRGSELAIAGFEFEFHMEGVQGMAVERERMSQMIGPPRFDELQKKRFIRAV